MRTPIEELRKNATKIIESPYSKNRYLIRKLNHVDYNRESISTMLPADLESEKDADGKPKPRTFTAEDMRRIIDRTQYVLERGATIFFGPEPDTPADSIHVNWIAGDEGFLSDEIIKFSGLDVESQQKLSDLLKNGNGSESSIVSAESTASSQAS